MCVRLHSGYLVTLCIVFGSVFHPFQTLKKLVCGSTVCVCIWCIAEYFIKLFPMFSFMMIVCWTSGDLFKTGYFFLREAPMQFWVCGTIQVMVDVAILVQIFIYRNQQPPTPSHHATFKISVT